MSSVKMSRLSVWPSTSTVERMIAFSTVGGVTELPPDMTYCAAELLGARGQYGQEPRRAVNLPKPCQKRNLVVIAGGNFAPVQDFQNDVLEVARRELGLLPTEPEDVFLISQLIAEGRFPWSAVVMTHPPIITKTPGLDAWRQIGSVGKVIVTMITRDVMEKISEQMLVFNQG